MTRLTRWGVSVSAWWWLGLGAALAVRLWFVWQPLSELLSRYNADDMYYYLTIARQIVAGRGVSFDGLAPTNGFHPLYLALLVAFEWLTPKGSTANIYLALTLLVLANVATALVLFKLVRRVARRETAYLAALVWLCNPFALLATLEGVETALATFFFGLVVLAYLCYLEQDDARARMRAALSVGVFSGLLVLARLDGALLLLALGVDWVWRAIRSSMRARSSVWREGSVGALSAGILLLPWFIWNWATFGTLLPVSGVAIAYTTHLGQFTWADRAQAMADSLRSLFGWVLVVNFQIALLNLGAAASALVLRRSRQGAARANDIRRMWFLALYALAWFVFYGAYFLHRQLWYLLPIMFVGTVGGVLLWERLVLVCAASARGLRLWFLGSSAAAILLFCAWWVVWQSQGLALHPAQQDGYRVAVWLKEHTPPHARIGAWNSGIIAYFSERTVINLDGVVNNPLTQRVMRDGASFALRDIWGDAQAARIDYLTDYERDTRREREQIAARALKAVYELESHSYPNFQVVVWQIIR